MIPRLQTHTLSNGVPLYIAEEHGLPLVDVEIVFQPGAVLDAGENAGRVSLTSEMLEEGTTSRSATEIAEQLEFLGGYFDIHPTHDAVGAAIHVQSKRLEAALDVASDVLLHPAFDKREFERKRGEHIRSLRQELDDAEAIAARAFAAGVFGQDHPYGVPAGGTVAALSQMGLEVLQALHAELFTAANTFVLAVGDVDAASLIPMLESRLSALQTAKPVDLPPVPMPKQAQRRVLLIDKRGAEQAELRVGHVAPPRTTPDYFALVVMNAILGGSFTSRLNTILRERMGVTYGAGTRFRLRRDGGIFSAASAVFTEAAARSAQVVVEEMTRMQQELVDEEKLVRAQRYIALGLPRSFEATADIANHLREQIVQGLPADYWQTYTTNILAVSAEEVRNAAARHLQPEQCTIAIAADASLVQDALEAAKLGDVILTQVQA